jgi:4-hydroxybenzoate polyprenyltransferase
MRETGKIAIETDMGARKSMHLAAYVRLVRPKQWVKNFFVFGPLVFAKELFLVEHSLAAAQAFIAFCLAASAVYVLNDIVDVEADRAHPEKRFRPIAAGIVSQGEGYILIGILLGCLAIILAGMDVRFVLIVIGYFVINMAYSFKLKDVVLLDVFLIAAGFMMRVLGGAYAINVETSTWLVLCTLFISLFLGFAKRRGELVLTQNSSHIERKVLQRYRVGFLDQMLTIAASGTVISYALYTVAPRTLQMFGTDKLIYTTVFVIYGVFRYLYLIHVTKTTDNPTNALTADWPILLNAFLWVLSCILLIYLRG